MDFHPNMLATQRTNMRASAVQPSAGFHPGMLGRQQLAGLGAATPAPAAAATVPPAVSYDASTGEVIIGGNRIKLVSAVLSAVLVKLVFFSGNQVVKGAKHLRSRFSGSSSTTATNPGKRSERPWQAVRFNPKWRKLATKRHKTKSAGECWASAHGGPGRCSYVG